jgi:hypothetical protein
METRVHNDVIALAEDQLPLYREADWSLARRLVYLQTLATYSRARGREAVHQLLAEIYGWFTQSPSEKFLLPPLRSGMADTRERDRGA